MQMAQSLLTSVVPKKLSQYHLYFDNYFTSPDLLVHLKKISVRATGTVRQNRVQAKNETSNKSKRGSFEVQHDKTSGLNHITLKDSKLVSVLSTAADVTPLSSVQRYSKEERKKVDIPFPKAFIFYNKFMGGVDLQDSFCSNLETCIKSKKWTWPVFSEQYSLL